METEKKLEAFLESLRGKTDMIYLKLHPMKGGTIISKEPTNRAYVESHGVITEFENISEGFYDEMVEQFDRRSATNNSEEF